MTSPTLPDRIERATAPPAMAGAACSSLPDREHPSPCRSSMLENQAFQTKTMT